MNNIFLIGSEAVERAGSTIRSAADDMIRVSHNIDNAVQRLENILNEFIIRFENTTNEVKKGNQE